MSQNQKPAAEKLCAYVIGYPVKHSRSPMIHNYWLQKLGLNGCYNHAEIAPEDLSAAIAAMRAAGFRGANVTVPHKEAIFALCDSVSARAKSIGAVNTIWLADGQLHGDNTDYFGFGQNLTDFAPTWETGKTALVLGAGGAARAVVYALVAAGYDKIYLVNRSLERAQNLVALGPQHIIPIPWPHMPEILPQADIMVNTTSLGMKGQPDLEIDLSDAKPGLIVNDIVYVPLETALLRQARARGLNGVDGLGMLLHQAVPGFEHWFGQKPAVTAELRARVIRNIEGA